MQHELETAVLRDQAIPRDDIKRFLKKDVRQVHIILTEILQSEECLEALTEVFWQRYCVLHSKKEKEALADVSGPKS